MSIKLASTKFSSHSEERPEGTLGTVPGCFLLVGIGVLLILEAGEQDYGWDACKPHSKNKKEQIWSRVNCTPDFLVK